jgi:hypothetical protein
MYKYRQIYKAENEELCNKWIERINASIIYYKFWKHLIEKNSEIWEYYSKQSEVEELFDETKSSTQNEKQREEEKVDTSNSNVNSGSQVDGQKEKKQRRKNPFSNMNLENNGKSDLNSRGRRRTFV